MDDFEHDGDGPFFTCCDDGPPIAYPTYGHGRRCQVCGSFFQLQDDPLPVYPPLFAELTA